MGNINNPTQFGQMNVTDRVAIEVGLAEQDFYEYVIGRKEVE